MRRSFANNISSILGNRNLFWFGTRGCDALPLIGLPQFKGVFSLISPLSGWPNIEDQCLENLSGRRVDLDSFNIDDEVHRQKFSDELRELWLGLSERLNSHCVVAPYSANNFITAAIFPRINHVEYAGLFHERQRAFEHKVWVETELRKDFQKAGEHINIINWKCLFIDDISRPLLEEAVDSGRTVVRLNRSNGGNGVFLLNDVADIEQLWPQLCSYHDGYFSMAPFLAGSVPLNLNGVVFPDGAVRLHAPSIQILGDPDLSLKRFSYNGNDFGRVKDLAPKEIDSLEHLGILVGKWLAKERYVGAFGIDALVQDGRLYLAEVNPRFQGSSAVGAQLDQQQDQVDMYLNHMAAFFDLEPPPERPLRTIIDEQPAVTQVLLKNLTGRYVASSIDPNVGDDMDGVLSLVPEPGTLVEPNAVFLRLKTNRSLCGLDGRLKTEERPRITKLLEMCLTPPGNINKEGNIDYDDYVVGSAGE